MSQSTRKRSTRTPAATPPVTLLQDLALQALATTADAASHAVKAWRLGGHRLVATVDQRVSEPVARRAARYVPRLATLLRRSSTQAGAMADKGIDWASAGTGKLIDYGTRQFSTQVRRAAGLAYAVRQPLWLRSLDTAARFTMPGARAAVALSQRFAALAARLPADEARSGAAARPVKGAKATPAKPGKPGKPAELTKPTKRTKRTPSAGASARTANAAKTGARPVAPATAPRAAKPAGKAQARSSGKAAAQVATKAVNTAASVAANPVEAGATGA